MSAPGPPEGATDPGVEHAIARDRSGEHAFDSDPAVERAIERDVQLLLAAAAAGASDAVVRRLAAAGFADLRPSHGYVFQHLVLGPTSIHALGQKLGMTAQGASKAVIDLERLGYVRRVAAPADRRAHLVELTPRGQSAIAAGRQARAEFTAEVEHLLGEAGLRDFLDKLKTVADHSGGLKALATRRLRPGP